MSLLVEIASKRRLLCALFSSFLLAHGACSGRSTNREVRVPLVVIAGPEDFTSVEMRTPIGETLWRLEADTPSAIPFLVYAVVPEGFRQTSPATGSPRPLRIGEDLILESRMPRRLFVHRGFASTETTIAISSSEMRRLEPGEWPGPEPDASAWHPDIPGTR